MSDSPEVSFVIPAYNEAQELPLTLTCLLHAARCQPEFKYEIIVCDNQSTDHTSDVATSFGAKVVHESERQISRARNTGAHAAKGSWLIFIDADTRINRDLLASVFKKIRSNQYGLGGSIIQFDIDDPGFFPDCIISTWNLLSTITGYIAGSFIICPRTAFQQIGGFSQNFYAGEELEFSKRMHRWCRQHNLKFFVETSAPVITSGRKVRGMSTWEMIRQLHLLFPGRLNSMEACNLWYDEKWRA